jgi:hypothetical protein
MPCEKNTKATLAQLERRKRAALEAVDLAIQAKRTNTGRVLLDRMIRQVKGGC